MNVATAQPDLQRRDAEQQRLAEVYAPCFTLILQLRATSHYGDPTVLRQRIKDQLDQVQRRAARSGASSEDVRYATFAIVAFIDETILSSEWPQKDAWVARPLQLEFYNRYDAGEEFFTQLQTLLSQPDRHAEVLEVFYLCMTLGFKGRYQLHEQERLRILIEETHGVLRRTLGVGDDVLAPHGKPRDQVATEVQSKLPAWIVAVVALAIAVLVYFGLSLLISGAAQDAAEEIRTAPRATIEATQ